MKKILVTGATGFIGNNVILLLLNKGYSVVATSANPAKASLAPWFAQVTYIPLNLIDLDKGVNYYEYFDKPDVMIHLAWEGLPNYKSTFHLDENLPRHYNFIKNLLLHGLTDITVSGTCFEYGKQEGALSEEMETIPNNPYAMAKNRLRQQLQELQTIYNFSLKWVRLFYMYGPGQNPNSLLAQLDKALANGDKTFNMSAGEQVRDYLPVEKVAEYIVGIALQKKVTGIINCCSGEGIKIKDLVKDHLALNNAEIEINLGYYPYTDYEPMEFWGNDQKLRLALGR